MKLYRVQSAALLALGYEGETRTLGVLANGNVLYHYFEVEPDIWLRFREAKKKGEFWHRVIKAGIDGLPRYRFQRISEGVPVAIEEGEMPALLPFEPEPEENSRETVLVVGSPANLDAVLALRLLTGKSRSVFPSLPQPSTEDRSYQAFNSEKCPHCGEKKQVGHWFDKPCWKALPAEIKSTLRTATVSGFSFMHGPAFFRAMSVLRQAS